MVTDETNRCTTQCYRDGMDLIFHFLLWSVSDILCIFEKVPLDGLLKTHSPWWKPMLICPVLTYNMEPEPSVFLCCHYDLHSRPLWWLCLILQLSTAAPQYHSPGFSECTKNDRFHSWRGWFLVWLEDMLTTQYYKWYCTLWLKERFYFSLRQIQS
jgi:hypothetical protein